MKCILAALDVAPSARDVLAAARDLALATGARLVLFRAPDVAVSELDTSVDERRLDERMRAELMRGLEALRDSMPKQLACSLVVGQGRRATAICEAASDAKADVIVVGAHGDGSQHGELGAVTSDVLEQAKCDVLVIKRRRT
ncbi:MAG: universal stress protein [Deltaproteobacteria bacterium]|nr:universal stress protein [Deltaproteobacteria bacterium]